MMQVDCYFVKIFTPLLFDHVRMIYVTVVCWLLAVTGGVCHMLCQLSASYQQGSLEYGTFQP